MYVEFLYNRFPTFSIAYSPFEVVYGVNQYFSVDLIMFPKEELVYKDVEAKSKSIMKLHQQVCDHIVAVNSTYQ